MNLSTNIIKVVNIDALGLEPSKCQDHWTSASSPDALVEVILDNTLLYNNITEIITREYAIMNEIQSY